MRAQKCLFIFHVVCLEIVLLLTLKLWAISRTGSFWSSRRRIASRFWCSVNFGLRPSLTPRALARAALTGARADQISLELGQPAEHGQHQTAVCRGGVGPCVAERAETGFPIGDRRERV